MTEHDKEVASNPSAHYRYREQLQIVSSSDWAVNVINNLISADHGCQQSDAWKTVWSRFSPDLREQPYCSLLLQRQNSSWCMRLIEISQHKPTVVDRQHRFEDRLLGWVKISCFPDDPVLLDLPVILEQYKNRMEVIRYRPRKRCTFRCQNLNDGQDQFGKMFADNRGYRIYLDNIALWSKGANGELGFQVARPLSWDPRYNTLWQSQIQGQPLVKQLCSRAGVNIAQDIGQAAASLTTSNIKPSMVFDAAAQMRRTTKYAKTLEALIPESGSEITVLLEKLKTIHRNTNTIIGLKPIHGAPHAHQWLDCGDSLGLVDFDRFGLGHPELDAATFIGEMDFEDRNVVPVEAINSAFLDAYQSINGTLNHQLLQAYRSHKRLAKALKAAQSIRLNGDRKAGKHLFFAQQALQESLM